MKENTHKISANTIASIFVMGFSNLRHRQFVKRLIFLGAEIIYILFMLLSGINNLANLITLGESEQQEVWNEAKGCYEYTAGDNSLVMLLLGIATIFITIAFVYLWWVSIRSGRHVERLAKEGSHINKFKEDIKSLLDSNLHKSLLLLPISGILIFNILPLVFMISMAFTNYSKVDDHLVIFDWVGLKTFGKVLNFGSSLGKTFWGVLAWTMIWAFFATFTNYIFGMILAICINRKETKFKSFWRFGFVLSVAVPQFVSLLIMRTMLQPNGAVNVILRELGIIGASASLPFLTNAMWARVTVIIINLWVGVPFTMLQVTGILQNIPSELYESAKVDGANSVVIFFKITLPYMLFVTTPYLITTFTANVNNFNVIYLLSGGAPTPVGQTAGKTDLLVTWLYKLTMDKQYYNLGAVIGIMTFIVLAILSLVAYRNTGSYKNEEGFQ